MLELHHGMLSVCTNIRRFVRGSCQLDQMRRARRATTLERQVLTIKIPRMDVFLEELNRCDDRTRDAVTGHVDGFADVCPGCLDGSPGKTSQLHDWSCNAAQYDYHLTSPRFHAGLNEVFSLIDRTVPPLWFVCAGRFAPC